MSKVQFWYAPGACSLAIHILLREVGLQYEPMQMSVMRAIPEEFREVNPKMRVPVLVLDGQTITEVPAITTAISQLFPDKQLLGRNNIEIVRSYEWMNWLSSTMHGHSFGMLLRPSRYTDDESLHDAVRQRGLEQVQNSFEFVESKLTGLHAVGDEFTAVDAYLYVFFRWHFDISKGGVVAKYPKYSALVSKLLERQAVRDAIANEGIDACKPSL